MKIITLTKIGYNAPRSANWCYGVWQIALIDTKSNYCMSHTVKENFGGDSRLKTLFPSIIEVKGVYTNGTPEIKGVSKVLDMESKEVNNIIKDFLNK